MKKKSAFNVRCDLKLKKDIEALAQESGLRLSDYIVGVLTAAVAQGTTVAELITYKVTERKRESQPDKKRA